MEFVTQQEDHGMGEPHKLNALWVLASTNANANPPSSHPDMTMVEHLQPLFSFSGCSWLSSSRELQWQSPSSCVPFSPVFIFPFQSSLGSVLFDYFAKPK